MKRVKSRTCACDRGTLVHARSRSCGARVQIQNTPTFEPQSDLLRVVMLIEVSGT